MQKKARYLFLLILAGSLLTISVAVPPQARCAEQPSKRNGKQVFETKCLQCHKHSKFKDLHYARREWEQIVTRMELNTCILSDAEYSSVCDFLAKEHGE